MDVQTNVIDEKDYTQPGIVYLGKTKHELNMEKKHF